MTKDLSAVVNQLSPVDKLYLENPGPLLGGLIAFWLIEISGGHTLDLRPGFTQASLSPEERQFDSLEGLLEHLQREHLSSYRYRGQTRRWYASTEGSVETLRQVFPHLDPLKIVFEGFIPSALRSVFSSCPDSPARWHSWQAPPLFDEIASVVRAICTCTYEPIRAFFRETLDDLRLVAIKRFTQKGGIPLHLPPNLVAPGTELPVRLLQLISLAQHYEYGSVMVDTTDSPDIAAWFASHDWNGGLCPPTSSPRGVIYRFDLDRLNERISALILTPTATGMAISNTGLLGAADITTIGAGLGARPCAQRGGGLFGAEHAISALLLSAAECTPHTFPLASASGRETPHSKESLCPTDDPLLAVFTAEGRGRTGALSDAELSELLMQVGASTEEVESIRNCRSDGLI